MERKMQQEFDVKCSVSIDGYSDFIFVNRFGATQHQGTLNKAIKRIIRDCNDEVLLKSKEKDPVLFTAVQLPLATTYLHHPCG